MTFFNKMALVTIGFVLSGCVTESTKSSALVEGTATTSATKKITGKVFCLVNKKQVPVNNALVSVTKENSIMFSTTTAADGSYVLPSSFESDGSYGLQAKAACGILSRKLPKGAKDEIANENFILKK
ncbi:MAG: hypothetical protein H7256_01870 [Bdellovibrio sp.]|nr:hypothetical protein [Bdellovibrio sp.]